MQEFWRLFIRFEELIPEMSEGEHSNIGVVMFPLASC